MPATCRTQEARLRAELDIEKKCIAPIINRLSDQLAQGRQKFQRNDAAEKRMQRMAIIFGPENWASIHGEALTYDGLMFAYREALTLQTFERAVTMMGDNASRTTLILSEFLAVEPDLALIKHLPAILAWHRVLFEALGGGISREDAKVLTNQDALLRLPDTQQREAEGVLEEYVLLGMYTVTCYPCHFGSQGHAVGMDIPNLDLIYCFCCVRYCAAFNAVWQTIPEEAYIMECQTNVCVQAQV